MSLLPSIVSLNTFLATTFLPTLFLPLTPTLHALRVSLAYRGLRKKAAAASALRDEGRWLADLVGYLVMCWGGSFLVSWLSQTTPVPLLTIWPFLTYTLVHLYVTLFLRYGPNPNPAWLDTALPLIDGATRSAAIRGGITLAATSQSKTSGSLLCHVLAGTLGACGGRQLAGTLGVFNPITSGPAGGWRLTTPPILTAKSLVEATDVLAALAGALTYSLLSGSHTAWQEGMVLGGVKLDGTGVRGGKPWTADEAQAATTLVVGVCFAMRAVKIHHLEGRATTVVKRGGTENGGPATPGRKRGKKGGQEK